MDETTLARFLAKVEKQTEVTSPHVDTPCWLWTGCTHSWGYGKLAVRRVAKYAHRLAHEHWIGSAEGLFVCHRCDTPACVNPGHLFAGEPAANSGDMARKGRAAKPAAKLNPEKVRRIRAMAESGECHRAIAKRFGVSRGAIDLAVARKTWRRVK